MTLEIQVLTFKQKNVEGAKPANGILIPSW
jgi:hypothetical protein